MKFKANVMDESQLERSLARIAHEIIEKNNGADHICLLGIKRRGIPMAEIIHDNIMKFEGTDVPLGHIDISLYRDDLSEISEMPTTTGCMIPVDLREYTVILVDDVLFTGRTARAAIEAVFSHGRPKAIQLAVLIDRGHRELPIRPDYVGKNIPTSRNELVAVKLESIDGETGADLYEL
ncbi:MAG: bifunctional pyr operon transcriptional regulator/uracil phosphoribosyltransferase PyrR [Solobacterium sp.]|nr:bifunctional pyr operon transcriptional regulator/uracil phosphoribosyltransferase PyrR [Solobacterium sp.]